MSGITDQFSSELSQSCLIDAQNIELQKTTHRLHELQALVGRYRELSQQLCQENEDLRRERQQASQDEEYRKGEMVARYLDSIESIKRVQERVDKQIAGTLNYYIKFPDNEPDAGALALREENAQLKQEIARLQEQCRTLRRCCVDVRRLLSEDERETRL